MKKILLLCMAFMGLMCTVDAQVAKIQCGFNAERQAKVEGVRQFEATKVSPIQISAGNKAARNGQWDDYAMDPKVMTVNNPFYGMYYYDFMQFLSMNQINDVAEQVSYATHYSKELTARFAGNTIKKINLIVPDGAVYVKVWIKDNLSSSTNLWETEADVNLENDITLEDGTELGASYVVDCDYTITGDKELFVGYTVECSWLTSTNHFFFTYPMTNYGVLVNFAPEGSNFAGWWDFTQYFGAVTIECYTEGDNGLQQLDIAMNYAEPTRGKSGEGVSFPVQFTNMGAYPLSNITLQYDINGETREVNIPVTDENGEESCLTYLEAASFIVQDVAPTTPGRYPIVITPKALNAGVDTWEADNKVGNFIISFETAYARKAVMEQITGTWCGWCPRGHVAMELLKEKYPNDFIGIAVHWQDNFQTDTYSDIYNMIGSAPYALFNRFYSGDPFFGESGEGFEGESFVKAINATAAEAQMGVCSTVSADGASVELASHTTFSLNDAYGSYSVAYVIVEDGLSGGQTNYYSGEDMSEQPEELHELANMGSPYRTTFDDVARGIYNCWGIEGSLPTNIQNGQTYCHKTTVPMPSGIANVENCSVVALLIDNYSGEIVNAVKEKLNAATTGLESLNSGTLAAEISVAGNAINVKAAQGVAAVYATDGKLVAKTQVNGAATLTVEKGTYIVRVENGNDVVVKKVVL